MGAKILIADDTEEISRLLVDYLTMMGHEAASVNNGADLLQQAIATRPHLIITDIQMPGEYGSTVYLSLQREAATKNIPVIFISGQAPEDLVPNTPSTRFIKKPLEMQKLMHYIAELLPLGDYRP